MRDAVVVGAGLAGLAATAALARSGATVSLIDRKPFVGGRAYSYLHPALQEVVDSQHVMVGCCTNLRHLCEQAGMAGAIRWYSDYVFLEPGGRRSVLRPTWLPSPAHSSVSFLRAPMLSAADKLSIASALTSFVKGPPVDDSESVQHWLHRTKQPRGAIQHFWRPVIIGALNDTFDRCSLRYAGQVLHETFLRSAEGGRLGIPALPLSDFYAAVAHDAESNHAVLAMRTGVTSIKQNGDGWTVFLENGEPLETRSVLLALPFDQVQRLLPDAIAGEVLPHGLGAFVHSPITTVHLWFDREITDLDHAVLLDTTIEWIFHKSRIRKTPSAGGSYVELTISASHRQLRQSREEILSSALRELALFFPCVKQAVLQKSAVLKEAKATFSVLPGLDRYRPTQETAVRSLYLAGDWTSTGWPSTMEGAVRSGYLAAEQIAAHAGMRKSFVQPDLPPAGMMKVLAS